MSLVINNLQVSITDNRIIPDFSLTIKPGEIHAIMGPNGSGKSTLAAAVAGHPAYIISDKSQILLDDQSLTASSPDQRARSGLFLAFQYPIEIPGLSILNFLRSVWEARFGPLGPNNRFSNALELRQHIMSLAEQLSVSEHLLTRNLNEGFSGGERKRLEILQMAVCEPRYAFLDEADSGLDIDAIRAVAAGADWIRQKYQTGLIVITHYQRILKFLPPDHVHVMVGGRIVESGGPELAQHLEKSGYKEYQT